ncbi:hypothetical protein VE01_00487 [Pseudogymnoascus verrucosus]|uniref:Low affinity vacuolar monovalent cation/H(+) antiporter n=1 Tax=Pseudogymnoascus verrucosus TaxID=342668 RepID=A0A2P2SYI7_9PEZI|nr:uncharacterized protein VE01_00487 [Pseudogymnoascus verrucosus]OBU01345.1 hypothetical protein VE01_00487 [Pseudogymnoascus verrucosus]
MSSKDSSTGKAKASEGASQAQEQESGPSQTPVGSSTLTGTEAGHPLHRSQSITKESEDLLSSSVKSTDTVRRRPEAGTSGYGSISGPSNPNPSQGSERPTPRKIDSARSIQSAQSPVLGPERGRYQRGQKPAMTRRVSSTPQGPHRGQEFSVDDDANEIEGDKALRHGGIGGSVSGFGTTKSSLRRRPTATGAVPREDSNREEDLRATGSGFTGRSDGIAEEGSASDESQETIRKNDNMDPDTTNLDGDDDNDDDEDGDISDTESFTLKDRQEAINETHPFGIRIWKPALYKKDRSVQKIAEGDIHSAPGGLVSRWLLLFNIAWTILFGWWLALAALAGALVCFVFGAAPGALEYGRVLWGLSGYIFYPFGKFVRLEQDEAYANEDEGEGRSVTEYERWQSGDLEDGRLFFGPDGGNRSIVGRRRGSLDSVATETDSLLGRTRRGGDRDSSVPRMKRRLFGRGQWNLGRVIFFIFFYGLITPLLFIVSGICWIMVFSIPMGKVTLLLIYHLRRHPLALSFQSDTSYSRGGPNSSILLCTYRAVGLKYWKYTVDGTNIFFINLMAVVMFVILDYWVLREMMELDLAITQPAFLFVGALLSIIPLAYFIGQAVASISAQSSMGLGAAINAFFSTLVEVYLYCVALNQGKGQLVEGSIIGSIFAGILFLPGLSMCFGAIKRKTQRFNAKSAGVTSTMLLFAVIAAFGPTLFYQIYGTHELSCLSCIDTESEGPSRDCRRCYFSQTPSFDDRFYIEAVRPYCWFAATLLFLSYIIGLWFTLRTHAAVIWNIEVDEKKIHAQDASHLLATQQAADRALRSHQLNISPDTARTAEIRDSPMYKKFVGQPLKQGATPADSPGTSHNGPVTTPHMVPPRASLDNASSPLTEGATDPTVDTAQHTDGGKKVASHKASPLPAMDVEVAAVDVAVTGAHDAPNWSRTKSSVILMSATILYALIAEILVDTVDVVLQGFAVDEKFLGITLFALVPNTTEFLNAISFAMNGNIALSMEIGSAYALQVCLLQIPALVLFSAVTAAYVEGGDAVEKTFNLIFPQWDMVTVILCVFLLSYMYGEGKSNYFKGSILILSYFVVIVGFWFSSMADTDSMGMSRFDVIRDGAVFATVGRGKSGVAFQRHA